MKSFKDFGLKYKPAGDKKSFECKNYPLKDIFNERIIINDYEKDIETKMGTGRYLVHFKFIDNSIEGKFFTNSNEMKYLLNKISDMNGFPFETVIKRAAIGDGIYKYSFS